MIIAIHGKKEHGKSTVAKAILKKVPAVIKPFAKPIKDFATLLGWDGAKDAKGRRLLQLLGTEVGRECISETLWVDKWQESLTNTGKAVHIVCDDLRFQNEYEHLVMLSKTQKVYIIHVIRPMQIPMLGRLQSWFGFVHKSERGIKFNTLKPTVIYNSGTVSQLAAQVEKYIDERT